MSETMDISTLLSTLQRTLAQLYSNRQPDRKRGSENLRELLLDEDQLAKILDTNSLQSRSKSDPLSQSRNWNSVFDAARAYFEQVVTSKGTNQQAFNFLQSIVKRANANGPFISCDSLYDFILSKLNDPSLPDGFSFGFMQLLQNLLTVNFYTASLRGTHWKHILLTLISLYKNSSVPKTMILETLNVSIIHGSNIPEVILVLRKQVVEFYRYVCLEDQNRAFLPTVLINKGIILLCRYNAVEFRGILCSLGESLIPSILTHNLLTPMRGHEEESSVIDVLLIQLQLHAPCDVGSSSPAFHAANRTIWDDALDRIYTFAVDLVEETAKKSGYTKNVRIPSNLLSLAVKATKLVQERRSSEEGSTGSGELYPPPKRHMMHKSFHAIVSDTVHYQTCEAAQLVWIQYISAVLSAFPEISDCNMIYRLHRLGVSLLNSPFIVREEVYIFLRSVLYVEKYLIEKGLMEKPNSWSHVWDIVIKSLEVNEAKSDALEFIRSLLIEVDSNANSLLFLFLENGLEPCRESLNLLSELLSRCSLPDYVKVSPRMRIQETDKFCPRVALIKWIVSNVIEKCVGNSEKDVARLLTALLVNRSSLFLQTESDDQDYQISAPFKSEFEDFEPWLLTCAFLTPPGSQPTPNNNLPQGQNGKRRKKAGLEERGVFSVMEGIGDKLFTSLQEDLEHSCPPLQADKDFPKKLPLLQYRVKVLLNVLNLLEIHGLGEENELKGNVAELFETAFKRYASIIFKFLTQTEMPTTTLQLYSVLRVMRNLLEDGHLCPKLKQTLAAKYTPNIIEFWKHSFWAGLPDKYVPPLRNLPQGSPTKEFFSVRLPEGEDGTDDKEVAVSEKRATEFGALEGLLCLLDFSAINIERKSEILKELLMDCKGIGIHFNPNAQFYLDLCVEVIGRVILCFPEMRECHMDVMTLLQSLCRTYHADMNCAVRIWELFGRLGSVVGRDGDETVQKHFMALVNGMTRKLDTYGIDVVKIGFKSLSILAKSDPLSLWTLSNIPNQVEEKWIFPLVANLLKSGSQQVRIGGVNLFCDVFQAESLAPMVDGPEGALAQSSSRRKELYELIYTKLLEVYNPPGGCSEEETIEESNNRTYIVVSCLVKTVFLYPFNQKRALFCLFLILKLKSINISLVNRALKNENPNPTKTLSAHILYTLEKWLKLRYTILEFPFQLFDCTTPEEFFSKSKYRREISFQLFQYSEVENSILLEDFAKLTSTPVLDLIKDCYGMIMSRLILGLGSTSGDEMEKHGKSAYTNLTFSYTRLINLFGNVVNSEDYLKVSVDQVILNMIGLTFEGGVTSSWDCGIIRLPEPEPPFYDESKIRAGLDQLRHKLHLKGNLSVIGHLVKSSPRKLYGILLTLLLRIHQAHDRLEKYWRLHHYSFFVKLLFGEPRDVFDGMRGYASQFTVHSYLRLLQEELDSSASPDFATAVLHILTEYVQTLTELSSEEMGLHFRVVVSQVIAVGSTWPETIPVVTKLLDFLMKTSGVTFAKCISSLDPFPGEIESFAEYREIHAEFKYGRQRSEWTLDRELRTCLELNASVTDGGGSCCKERLRFIKQLLAQRKFDLEELVKGMGTKRFWDECDRDKDIIHGLTQMLLGVITGARDEESVLEACRCLGEIGPVDLAVLVLPSSETQVKLSSASKAIEALLTSAAENLLSMDIDLVAQTGQVLESLLQTTECMEVLDGRREDKILPLTKTNPTLAQILIPFQSESPGEGGKVLACNPSTLESQLSSLEVTEYMSYSKWVTQLTCGLIMALRPETSFLHRLLPLCRLKVSFCQEVLPYVTYECLLGSKSSPIIRGQLSSYFRKFFRSFSTLRQSTSASFSGKRRNGEDGENLQTPIHANKLALRSLLRVIQFLRLHELPFEKPHKTAWDNNFWLEVNYLDLAKAAQFCGAFLSSILYSEIHAYRMDDKEESLVQGFGSYEVNPRGKQNKNPTTEIEKLLLKAYISIGESDAVYGCGSARYSDFTSNVQHLAQMNQWGRSLAAFDSSYDRQLGQIGISTSLKELGLFSTLWTYLQGADGVGSGHMEPELAEIQYECGWRLSKWDLNCDKANYVQNWNGVEEEIHGIPTVQKSIYESIQSALNNDKLRHVESIRRGFMSIVQDLKNASLESAENLYPFLTQFQMFRIVEDFYSTRSSGVPVDTLLQNWQLLDKLGCSNLKFQEPVLYLRSILLKAFNEQQSSPTLSNSYDECILHLLSKARDSGRLELAESCASKICSRTMMARKEVEVAKNHWARGEQDIALSVLGQFLSSASGRDHNSDIQATSLLLCGEWLSETRSENPNTIMDQYFTTSVKLYESKQAFGSAQEISKAYITLARYADSLYQNASAYGKSEMFQEKMRTLHKAKVELDQMQLAVDPMDVDGQRSMLLLKRQINLDTQETQSTQTDSKRYLGIALKYYLRGLKHSSQHDLLIFRAIGLWLDNTQFKETLDVFNTETLPSYKYVMVLHQLSARLGLSGHNGVGEALQRILLKCAQDHPYHTLPVLLAQALMDKDKEHGKTPIKKNVRVDAARHLVERLKNGALGELTSRMELVWTALISLANVTEQAKTSGPKIIPTDALLRKLQKNINIVPIPTLSLNVSPTGKYKNSIIGIHGFDHKYVLVGGMNSPKKIVVTGTNGRKYNMLLKGQDDLRQDAVMQQVFAVMNKLLVAEPTTKARQLQIRTYKVVPLSQRSGLIEWCEDTQTFGEYLIKNHRHYRPADYDPTECRKKMGEVATKPNPVKMETYNDIMAKCKPVFRHFFFERFKDPGTFFERRLAYTRSVATSSMVGYILGLGDRHVLNILVDLKTAEFIHIDLGVAFDQGRILPTPETVPFRLTRDVVDGMGFCGVEGDFRRSCEMTLEVLRNNTEIILTILEVLLYDPLYIWTLSDDRVRKVQPGGRNAKLPLGSGDTRAEEPPKERNNSAARVLLRLRQKLVGVEEGISSGSTLSTSGHVSFLIQRASDSSRLSRLFPGWQPYL